MLRRTLVRSALSSSLVLAAISSITPTARADEAAASAAPTPPSEAVIREASDHYEAGLALYADGEFKRAAIEFDRAYELVPNYRALYNIGQVRIQLHDYARAMKALRAYLKEGGDKIDNERKKSVDEDLEMLSTRTALLTIETNEVGAEVLVDGDAVGLSPLPEPLLLDTGDHRIAVRKEGFLPHEELLTLASRDTLSARFDLQKEMVRPPVVYMSQQQGQSDRTAWIWGTWSATAAFAAGAGVTGILGIKSADDLAEKRSKFGASRDELDSAQRRAETLLRVADILGGAAIVTGGVALYLTLSKPAAAKKEPAKRAGLYVGPRAVVFKTSF